MAERLSGTRLGAYEVREFLGSGGMAEVYKGYDPALAREVAIKIIGTSGKGNDFVARFQREARVAANLRHPHIVQIYAFGQQRSIVYMVQELLPGPTLAQRMREAGRRRMAAERVHTIVEQLAAALSFAHGQGVIHRDVKPANAIYNHHGQLVLTDFGIARNMQDGGVTTTDPGMVMGTPGYIAPEQAISSAGITPACDIYSLGVLLFELLTGRLPFEADTPMGLVLKHLYDDPPRPSSLRTELPPALDRVVLRALHKEPQERYPSTQALARALKEAWPAGRGAAGATAAKAGEATAERRSRAVVAKAATAGASAPIGPRPRATGGAQATSRPAGEAAPRARQRKADNGGAAKPAAPRAQSTPDGAPRATALKTAASTQGATPAPNNQVDVQSLQPMRSGGRHRLRVGLLTACVVGGLLLFGFQPDALQLAWQQLIELMGR